MRYKTILFDIDGTLFDWSKAEVESLKATFYKYSFPFDEQTLSLYRSINHDLWRRLELGEIKKEMLLTQRFSEVFSRLGLSADPAAFNEDYLQGIAQRPILYDGAVELCRDLAEKHRLIVVTNGVALTQYGRISRTKIGQYFSDIVISQDAGCEKPDPRFFEYVFATCGLHDKASVLIVGDGLTSDIQGGINAGIDTCWYNPHYETVPSDYSITHIAHDYDDVRQFIESAQ